MKFVQGYSAMIGVIRASSKIRIRFSTAIEDANERSNDRYHCLDQRSRFQGCLITMAHSDLRKAACIGVWRSPDTFPSLWLVPVKRVIINDQTSTREGNERTKLWTDEPPHDTFVGSNEQGSIPSRMLSDQVYGWFSGIIVYSPYILST